jgi:L-cysteine S-thiosulfotransferase
LNRQVFSTPVWRLLAVTMLLLAGTIVARAADETEVELDRYRAMMKADPWANPAMLDVDRGEDLWRQPRGPKNVALATCDLGLGAGVIDGAFAALPRFFSDAGKVMDLETRLMWCMSMIQGFDAAKLAERPHPSGGAPVKDLGAIATFVASKSSGVVFKATLDHPKEVEAVALGEAIFNRRMGPFDFACTTCHADSGKRIRRQALPYLAKPAEAQKVIGEWPAYRVSSTHVMTMQHRIYDCFWQMRMPEIEIGSDATVALVAYMTKTAQGGPINVPGMKR